MPRRGIKLQLAAIAMLIGLMATATAFAVPEPRFYPAPPKGLVKVGTEQFENQYLSLLDLEGVFVDLEAILGSGKKPGFEFGIDLEAEVKRRFKDAGLAMLDKNSVKYTPGQPILNLWPSYKGEPGSKATDSQQCRIEDSCKNGLWTGFSQAASLLRDPSRVYRLGTWGSGDESKMCEDRGNWMANAVLEKIDLFIKDYRQAQAEKYPVMVSEAKGLPEACAQAWLTTMNVFDTNETHIEKMVKPIFDKFAKNAKLCEDYSYIVETHADQRADDHYNRILSIARAHSVKDYLQGKGLPYARIKIRPMGETQPLSLGSTEKDHAANRRVAIRPVRNDVFAEMELEF